MSTPAAPDSGLRELLARARTAAANAHAPYSRFKVGAAVRTVSGAVFAGCNVENASYGLTVCAERNAIAAAVTAEGPGMRLQAVAVFVDAPGAFPPCGACRQVVAEFASPATPVVFSGHGDETPAVLTIGELLPQAFRL